jgi:AraC-like DNA-binding protein
LISYGQRLEGDEETQIRMRELKRTRHAIKRELLTLFNANFGSCFRTSTHRTSFFEDVGKFADVYTSSVSNVLHYEPNYTFYAQRAFYPHERPISIDDDEAS